MPRELQILVMYGPNHPIQEPYAQLGAIPLRLAFSDQVLGFFIIMIMLVHHRNSLHCSCLMAHHLSPGVGDELPNQCGRPNNFTSDIVHAYQQFLENLEVVVGIPHLPGDGL